MLGRIVPTREVQARWSFAEITGRFKHEYSGRFHDVTDVALIAKIQGGQAFESLTPGEKETLARWNETGFRHDFADAFRWYGTFRAESWSKEQLLRLNVVPTLDPQRRRRVVPLLSFLTAPRFSEATDPRVQADRVPLDEPLQLVEPLITGHWGTGEQVLWEGYFRAALFVRSEDLDAHILVWVPHEGNWPGRN
jgi:hypothetical protein